MVGMELTPFGDVTLGIWISQLPEPSDGVTQTFHDGDYLYGLNVVIVLRDTGAISQSF